MAIIPNNNNNNIKVLLFNDRANGGTVVDPTTTTTKNNDMMNIKPSEGDNTKVNNFISMSDSEAANCFFCPVRITLGGFDGDANEKVEKAVLPTKVKLSAVVSSEQVLYEYKVSFCNDLPHTVAAVLDVARLPGVLLMEEAHECAGIRFEPRVMEKEKADTMYAQAADSSNQTATLSSTVEDTYHVQLDKVPAGADGTFGLTFIQAEGLKSMDKVLTDGSEAPLRICDLFICPGYTYFDFSGVPFDFNLMLVGNGLTVDLPSNEIIAEDVMSMEEIDYLQQLILFGPNLVQASPTGSVLSWKSPTGFSKGSLLKIRISQYVPTCGNVLTPKSCSAPYAVKAIDVIEKCCFSSSDGSANHTALVDIEVPLDVPNVEPSPEVHEIYIIVDTSGSTSLPVKTNEKNVKTFLDTSKLFLDGVLNVLPHHIGICGF